MVRKYAVAVASVLLASTGIGLAADLPSSKMPPSLAPLPQTFSWAGFYVGVHGGYVWGKDTTREYLTVPWTFIGLQNSYEPKGGIFGLHAGGNVQFGNIVAGIEADVDFGRIKGGFVDPPAPPFNPGGRGNTVIDTQGSLRARIGYAFDNVLVYATGGLALANHKSTYFNWPGVGESFTRTIKGYTVGGGVEYALTQSISIRGEYRFTEFEKFNNDSQVAFPGFTGTQEPRYHTVRAGLTYRF